MENSPDMPAHMFKDAFKSKGEYVFVDLVLNPFSDWGVQRKRRWQAALKVSTVIWSGAVGAEDQQAQFDAIFGHGTDGQPPPAPPLCDAYLVSSADEEKAHCNALAAKRGLYPRPGHTVPLGACLSECYLKHAQLLKKVHLVSWKHSCFAADISQNPKYCVRGGDALPAATTSSLFFSFSQDRFFTPKDLACAHGWPVSDGFWPNPPPCLECRPGAPMILHSRLRVILFPGV
ncbi:unnamed protein product [Prorocentrum cordatum]|uniref:Uncharacterized protein n=1 Tax=Prorocentrum cordatum TaxID=2364126 RepID=A0ABN9UW92_9DINO|nr:unnamed protein product [Polarella glacialis]